ncbi:MAG: ATP-NAD kinase family protein [Nitrososphaeria archaeon]|nr:ATP-NAD kinase family protein [Nitrososphaeria archaeon]
MKLGFIVNPIAGMGGSVGLKGTDGPETYKKAMILGAKPIAPEKAKQFLAYFKEIVKEVNFEFYVAPKKMGEEECKEVGLNCTVVGEVGEETSSEDTIKICKHFLELNVDLIVFVGGDGTARDVVGVVGQCKPIIGIPSGVKVYSSVFAVNVKAAAETVYKFISEGLPLRDAEVVDVDEDAFRSDILSIKIYSHAKVPYAPTLIQVAKTPTLLFEDEKENMHAIAKYIIENIDPNTLYILGPGTTVKAITDMLGVNKTILGVDILLGNKLIAKDVNEQKIIEILEKYRHNPFKVIVSPLGAQGYVFGRGNQQISPRILSKISKDDVIVISTRFKLQRTPILRIDTGDPKVDEKFKGYIKVIIDYNEELVTKIE